MLAAKAKKVALGLSGGVDSAVSGLLLKKQGYEVTGVYMQCWDEKADGCRAAEDRIDAVKVSADLKINFDSINFISEYKKRVIENFYSEYEAGRTPNPDVLCNKEIKFGLFMTWALKNGFDYVATGHYARVKKTGAYYDLYKGVDASRDQSYFLYRLGQTQLAKTLFPLGGLKKSAVRELAESAGLHVAQKPDSVGICFVGEVDLKKFLQTRLRPKRGKVVTKSGEVIGSHDGVWYYTIGQRHGFTISKYVGLPLYVCEKHVAANELVVGYVSDALKQEIIVEAVTWLREVPETLPLTCWVRVRHLGELFACTLTYAESPTKDQATCIAKLKTPVFGVAPGQSAVFYVHDRVIGGGLIG